jgi:hypothetical protein
MSGEVCCVSVNFRNMGVGTASCQASCSGGDGGMPGLQLCTSNADCPQGDTCQRDFLGLNVCQRGGGFNFDGGIGRFFDGGGFNFDGGIGRFFDGGGFNFDGGGFNFDGGGRRRRDGGGMGPNDAAAAGD